MERPLDTTASALSPRQLEKNAVIEHLVDLYSNKYLLRRHEWLRNTLFAYLYSGGQHWQSPTIQMKIVRLFFKEEYLFSREAFVQLGLVTEKERTELDFQRLLEMTICTHWGLCTQPSEVATFMALIDSLLQIISCHLHVSEQFFETHRTSFLHHVKFLAFRILKKEKDYRSSDDELYFLVKELHPEAFKITHTLRKFITETYDFDLSNNEVTYLCLHIVRSLNVLQA